MMGLERDKLAISDEKAEIAIEVLILSICNFIFSNTFNLHPEEAAFKTVSLKRLRACSLEKRLSVKFTVRILFSIKRAFVLYVVINHCPSVKH